MKRLVACVALFLMVPGLSGCWYAAAAGAGVYAGYKAKEKGYGLQNPVTKEDQNAEESSEQP